MFCLPSVLFPQPYATVLESSEGKLLGAKIADDGQWRFPEVDSVPYRFKMSVLQFEENMLLIEAIKDGSLDGLKILPPLFIHNEDGSYTDEIHEIYYGN